MTAKDLYLYAIDQATAVVVQVEPEQMDLPTPDSEWTVHDLLMHTMYELAWTADIVSGKTISEVGDVYNTDLLTGEFVDTWRQYEAKAKRAIAQANDSDIAHLSYMDTTVEQYLYEAANDQLVHSWDLGQAIGVSVVFEDDAAHELYERMLERQQESSTTGLFGPAIASQQSDTIQVKLLHLLGRSETWPEVT